MLTTQGHQGKVYELTGDVAITQPEFAAEISAQSGKPVVYTVLSKQEYAKALEGFGVPAARTGELAQADVAISRGALAETTDTLATLIGRPTTTLAEAVAQALGK